MARRRSFFIQRHREVLQRAGLAVIALAIVAIGFNSNYRADDSPALAKGSLIVNINTATREEIETVPGVGWLRAMQITSNRPYASVDQLERVYGIAPEQVEQMRPYVKVEGETESFARETRFG
jgi:helix-hairpin-helix protein